ncbi:MAG: hypothetical protein AB4372_26105 [Xenococcus sp. (in: cyanobacteria)]
MVSLKNHLSEVLAMKKITLPINLSQEEIKQFCQCHSIRKLSLFGSVDLLRINSKKGVKPLSTKAFSDF